MGYSGMHHFSPVLYSRYDPRHYRHARDDHIHAPFNRDSFATRFFPRTLGHETQLSKLIVEEALTLDIIEFDGSPEYYPYFKRQVEDARTAGNHSDAKILSHPKGKLKGMALQAVRPSLLMGGSLSDVMNVLQKHFGDSRVVVRHVTEPLLEQPKVKPHDVAELLTFSVQVNNTVSILKGLFRLYLFRFRNTNQSENTRCFCVNRNRNSIPVLVYKPGQSWFTVGGNPTTRRNTNTNKWVGIFFFFFMLEHRRFRFFPCLRRSSLENNLLRARLRRSTASATSESTINYSSSCSASFSPLFPSKRTAVNTAAALHFLLVTMNTRSKTDEKERRRQRGWRRQGVCWESRPYFSFEFRFRTIMFSHFFPFQFEIKQCAILLPWKLFLSNESRSFCTRLFLFRFINRNRNTAQKEYALRLCSMRENWTIYNQYRSSFRNSRQLTSNAGVNMAGSWKMMGKWFHLSLLPSFCQIVWTIANLPFQQHWASPRRTIDRERKRKNNHLRQT